MATGPKNIYSAQYVAMNVETYLFQSTSRFIARNVAVEWMEAIKMNLYYRIKNTISDFWYDFRSRCQRFKRGWAYGDVWDIDAWFMRTVKPMLTHLRDHGIGFPGIFNHRDEWNAVLTEMINCLDMMYEDNVYESLGFYDDVQLLSMEDYKRVGEIMEENKNRFFELFSEYFFYLWD